MKIAFVADTHFGYSKYEEDARAQGRAAVLDACSRADVLVLGGDIFDHRIPKLETLSEVAQLLQQAQAKLFRPSDAKQDAGSPPGLAGSPPGPAGGRPRILGIHGTHERRARDLLNPIAMMAKLGLMEDLHNRTVVLEGGGTAEGPPERVAFCGLGGIPDDLMRDALSRLSCRPVEGAASFFVFHQTLSEFVPQAPGLASIQDLPAGYDWYLCGHIHARKEYLGGRLLIPGSTVMTQMKDEEGQQKGYYLIDTKTKKSEFVPIRTRPFEVSELAFDNARPADARRAVEEEIARLLSKNWEDRPILKIRLAGTLAKGAGELELSGLCEDARAHLFIDNQMDGGGLASDLEKLREERMRRATPQELGMALLRENAKAAGLDARRAEEYFEEFTKEG